MASNNRKCAMTGEQVLCAINALSDSDNFDENDSDRDSTYDPSDNETADPTNYSDSLNPHCVLFPVSKRSTRVETYMSDRNSE